MFDQFSQADSSATREYGGFGLRLAIAREIVALHDGTIVAGNRPAGGAVFVVRLPKRRAVVARVSRSRAEPGRREERLT